MVTRRSLFFSFSGFFLSPLQFAASGSSPRLDGRYHRRPERSDVRPWRLLAARGDRGCRRRRHDPLRAPGFAALDDHPYRRLAATFDRGRHHHHRAGLDPARDLRGEPRPRDDDSGRSCRQSLRSDAAQRQGDDERRQARRLPQRFGRGDLPSRFENCQAWNGAVDSNTAGGDGGGVYVALGATSPAACWTSPVMSPVWAAALSHPPTVVFAGGRGGALANAGTPPCRRRPWTIAPPERAAVPGAGGDGGGIANFAAVSCVSKRPDAGPAIAAATARRSSQLGLRRPRRRALLCSGLHAQQRDVCRQRVGTSLSACASQGGGLLVGRRHDTPTQRHRRRQHREQHRRRHRALRRHDPHPQLAVRRQHRRTAAPTARAATAGVVSEGTT